MPKTVATSVGKVHDGVWVSQYPDVLAEQLRGIPDGTWLSVSYSKPGKQKTLPQLGYYYAVVLPIIWRQLADDGWTITIATGTDYEYERVITHDEADAFLKRQFAQSKKRRMSRDELSDFLERCIAFGNGKLKCKIPPADPAWRDKAHE